MNIFTPVSKLQGTTNYKTKHQIHPQSCEIVINKHFIFSPPRAWTVSHTTISTIITTLHFLPKHFSYHHIWGVKGDVGFSFSTQFWWVEKCISVFSYILDLHDNIWLDLGHFVYRNVLTQLTYVSFMIIAYIKSKSASCVELFSHMSEHKS